MLYKSTLFDLMKYPRGGEGQRNPQGECKNPSHYAVIINNIKREFWYT